jgi:hypothetical protein
MTVEEALEIAQSFLDQGSLSKVQEIVFRQSWERLSYPEIAKSSGYEVGYIRDVGSKLWQSLSKAFGNKVTKNNFHGVLKRQYPTTRNVFTQEWRQTQASVPKLLTALGGTANQRQDWGEAVDISVFYGRTAELATLKEWIVESGCRLVTLLGMGGIGKTSLAVKLAEQFQDEFNYLIWRSLRNAPPVKDLLTELISFLCHQQESNLSETTVDRQISCLMECLRSSRCLLVLDNWESVLRSGERAGHYRFGYEGYGQLLQRVGDERHQSCLVLTSREKPIGLTAKEGVTLPVRSLQIGGLGHQEAQEILKDKGLVVKEDESRLLVEQYSGNPLALKIATTMIQSLFDGDVYRFREQGTVVFGDIWDLLDQQFHRLSALEKQVMYCIANNHKWVTLPKLLEDIVPTVSHRELLETLESLQRRSLIERHSASFTQQPMIVQYMTERGTFKCEEFMSGTWLVRFREAGDVVSG